MRPDNTMGSGVPHVLGRLVAAAQAAENRLAEAPSPSQIDAYVQAWEAVVAHPQFRGIADELRCTLQARVGLGRLRRYRELDNRDDLSAAIAYFELAVVAADPRSDVRPAVMHQLASALGDRYRLTQDEADLVRSIETLREAANEANRGTELRAAILQALAEMLVVNEPREPDRQWAQHMVEAVSELLAEAPDDIDTRKQRAILLSHQGFAHVVLGSVPGTDLREVRRAVEVLHEAQRLMGEVGDRRGLAYVDALAEQAEQMLAIAERSERPWALSLDSVDAWLAEESDPQRRVERIERSLTESTPSGGTALGMALFRLSLTERLLNEIRSTTRADVELVIQVAEQELEAVDELTQPELAFLAHAVLGVAYKKRAAGSRAANLELAFSHFESSLRLDPFQAPRDQADLLLHLAEVLKDKPGGDPEENVERALECARTALEVQRAHDDVAREANARMILGVLYWRRRKGRRHENSDRAIAELALAAELLDPERDRVNWGSVQHNLGVVYAARRWHGASEENLRRAVHHYRLSLTAHPRAERPYDWAQSQLSLANAYSMLAGQLGDPAGGQELLQQAVTAYLAAAEIFNRHSSPHSWAAIQANLGAAFVDPQTARSPDPQRAAVHFRAALEVINDGSDPWLWAWCVSGLGSAIAMSADESHARGDHAAGSRYEIEAEPLLRQSMDAMQSTGTRVEWAQAALGLLQLLGARFGEDYPARTEEAISLGQRVLDVLEGEGAVHGTYQVAGLVAGLLARLGRWEDAAEIGLRGLASLEISYRASLLRASKRVEMSEMHRLIEVTVVALLRVGRNSDALLALERGRARELADALARDRTDLSQLAEADSAAYEEYCAAAEKVAAAEIAERAIASGLGRHDPLQPAQNLAAEQAQLDVLDSARQAADRLEQAVQRIRRLEGFEDFLAPPGIEVVDDAVADRQPLVYLLPARNGTEVLAACRGDAGRLKVEAWTLPEPTVSYVAALALGTAAQDDSGHRLPGYLPAQEMESRQEFKTWLPTWMSTLGKSLAAPLAQRIAALTPSVVALVPCGLLSLFPMPCVPYDETGRCLLDDHGVIVVPSARALAASRAAAGSNNQASRGFAGVGDPTRDLPFARAELVSVARQVPSAFRRKLLFGDGATVAEVNTVVTGAELVHFACHAVYDASRPLESALILGRGARLTLRELMGSRSFRDARLVVASACRTGTTATTLPDEATGLATGLLQAGSAAVVASLWTVSEISSTLVITRFYSLLFPKNGRQEAEPAQAMRKAQLWLRSANVGDLVVWCRSVADGAADLQEPGASETGLAALEVAVDALAKLPDQTVCPFEHPYYWAPYIVVGV